MDVMTFYIILFILCIAMLALVAMYIYQTRKVSAICGTIDYLLRKTDYMEGELAVVIRKGNGGCGDGYTGGGREKCATGYEDDGK